jgi:hypothetical protein
MGTTLGTNCFAFSFVITICCERKNSGTFQARPLLGAVVLFTSLRWQSRIAPSKR